MRTFHKYLFVFFLVFFGWSAKADNWTENFDSGLPTGYTEGPNTTITLSGRIWTSTAVIAETAAASRGGSGSAVRINDDIPAAHITTPALNTIGTVSFYYRELNSGGGTFKIQKSTDGSTFTDVASQTYSGNTFTLFSFDVNDASTTIYIRILSNNNAGHLIIDDFSVTDYTASFPEIDVLQSAVAYATTSTFDFGFTSVGANNDVVFTIENNGTEDLTITTPLATSGGDYSIIVQPASTVIAGNSTTFTVRFTPSTAGTRTSSVTISNNDSDEGSYLINFTGVGVSGSSASDIVENSSFVYPENINYALYTGTNVTSASIEVFRFDIRDGGATTDGDALSTILNQLNFFVSNFSQIEKIALYDGTTELGEVASANNISFTGFTATALDNGTKTLSLRVTFKTIVTDNAQFSFTITNAVPDISGSVFASANAGGIISSTVGDDNRLEVTATTIVWGTQPSNGFINSNLAAFSINAVDAGGNIDTDESTCSVVLTTSGSGMTSGSPYTFVAGSISLNNVQFSSVQSGITVTATAQTCLGNTAITSNTFDIISFTFISGDYRTNPSFPTNADINFNSIAAVSAVRPWQKYDGTNWNDVTTAGQELSALATKPDNVYIFHGAEGGNSTNINTTGTYNNIIVVGYAIVPTGNTLTIAASKELLVKAGGVLEFIGNGDLSAFPDPLLTIEDNGKLILDIPSLENTNPIWAGTEDFRDNSTLVIKQFRNSGGATTRSLLNPTYQVPVNTSGLGYRFGNIIYDYNPSLNNQTILPGLASPLLFCNNLTMINHSSVNYLTITANNIQSPVATIRGNLTVEQGLVSLGINYTNGAFQEISVLGNLDVQNLNPANPSKVYLHNFGGTATTLSKMWFYLQGNINVDVGALLATGYDANSEAHSWLYFTGTKPQNITGGGTIDISNAEINKADEHVYLFRTLPISDSLMFTSNNFITGADTLRLGTAASSGVQIGGNPNSFVTTNGTGVFQRMQVIKSSEYEFPIGPTLTSYNPAFITYSGTTDNFSARVEIGLNPTTGSDASFVNRTWNVSENIAGGTNAFMKFQWQNASHENTSFNRSNSDVYHYTSGVWNAENFDSRGGAGPYFCKAASITSFSPFAVGSTIPLFLNQNKDSINYLITKTENALSIYPNPSNGSFNVQIYSDDERNITYSVKDITGREIMNKGIHLEKGENEFLIDLQVSEGIYVLQLDNQHIYKLIVR